MVELLLTNVVHGIVALAWTVGVRRLAAPISPPLWANLLAIALVLPPLVLLARFVGLPGMPEALALLRMDLWTSTLARAGWPGMIVVGALLLGSCAIALVQEVWPQLAGRVSRLGAPRRHDPRLDQVLGTVHRRFKELGLLRPWGHPPRAVCLEIDDPLAALHGLVAPTVVVSRGLMARLDDEELEAVVAHELGHLARGGNAWLLAAWGFRLLQLASPASLVIFRTLVEAQEAACDNIAARATGRPAALASALLKVQVKRGGARASATPLQRARQEVVRRADIAATRIRVRALLDTPPQRRPTPGASSAAVVVLGLLLWGIG